MPRRRPSPLARPGDLTTPGRGPAVAYAILWFLGSLFMGFFVWVFARGLETDLAKGRPIGVMIVVSAVFALGAGSAVGSFFRHVQAAIEAGSLFVRAEPEGLSVHVLGPVAWRFLGVRHDLIERVVPWGAIRNLTPVVEVKRGLPVGSFLEVEIATEPSLVIPMLPFRETATVLAERIAAALRQPPAPERSPPGPPDA